MILHCVVFPHYTFLWPKDGPQWAKYVVSLKEIQRQLCFDVPTPTPRKSKCTIHLRSRSCNSAHVQHVSTVIMFTFTAFIHNNALDVLTQVIPCYKHDRSKERIRGQRDCVRWNVSKVGSCRNCEPTPLKKAVVGIISNNCSTEVSTMWKPVRHWPL